MLKFFFNKESKIVYAMEAVGTASLILLLVTRWPSGKPVTQQIIFWIFVSEYLFIRFCTSMHWYDREGKNTISLKKLITGDEKRPGIELQFKKAIVPTSYIIAVFGILLLIGAPVFILYIALVLLTVIAHVNVILIYFHIRDKEPLPVNFFTHNKHIKT